MKTLGNALAVIGILLVLYATLGRFIGNPTIGVGIVRIQAGSGLVMANSLMLISLLIKLSGK